MSNDLKLIIIYIIHKDGKVLLEERHDKGKHDGQSIFPGGGVEPEEMSQPELALHREIMEELGVTVSSFQKISILPDFFGRPNIFLHTYIINTWHGNIPECVLDYPKNKLKWVPLKDLLNSPINHVRTFATLTFDYLSK